MAAVRGTLPLQIDVLLCACTFSFFVQRSDRLAKRLFDLDSMDTELFDLDSMMIKYRR